MASKPSSTRGRSSSQTRTASSFSSNQVAPSDHTNTSLHVSFYPPCSTLSSAGLGGIAAASSTFHDHHGSSKKSPPPSSLPPHRSKIDAPELHNYETYTYDPNKHHHHHQHQLLLPRTTSGSTTCRTHGLGGPIADNTNANTTTRAGSLFSAQDLHQSLALLSLHDSYRLEHSHLEEPDTMDEAFRQHANPSRRKNRSTTHLDHLSLAPLRSRLPFSDPDSDYILTFDNGGAGSARNMVTATSRSYLEGKSAPTTPGILGRNPSQHPRTPLHPSAAAAALLPKKSQSATALQSLGMSAQQSSSKHRRGGSGTQTPTRHHHHRLAMTAADSAMDRDWLEHTGALLSDSAREYKGQAWLVSRDSSTSLTGGGQQEERDEEESSKRNPSGESSQSRRSSASGSRMGSRVITPLERGLEGGYFAGADLNNQHQDEQAQGSEAAGESEWAPNFVNLNENLEAAAAGRGGDPLEEDEAAIRILVRNGGTGVGSWIGGIVGWPLFSVDEGEESAEEEEEAVDESQLSRTGSMVHFDEETLVGGGQVPEVVLIPPPPGKDQGGGGGGWQDAAWLLSVATKVLV